MSECRRGWAGISSIAASYFKERIMSYAAGLVRLHVLFDIMKKLKWAVEQHDSLP